MSLLNDALLAGAGGALGSAVLEALLARRRFGAVRVLVTRALDSTTPRMEPIVVDGFDQASLAPASPVIAETALIVFDRERHANGRELAFLRPAPNALVTLAGWLRARGVRALIVVMPHAPAQLPDALKAGLASLNEHAVSQLGFERLVFVRSAQAPAGARTGAWGERMANGLLAQLRIMVAATDQPVRASKVAQFVAELASRLGSGPPGTRVIAPEWVWQASQLRDPAPLVDDWLAGRELPALNAPRLRM